MKPPREIVLPSGRFATIRRLRYGDLVAAHDTNIYSMMAKMAVQLVLIDGLSLSLEDFMELEPEEFIPINNILMQELEAALKFKNGVT